MRKKLFKDFTTRSQTNNKVGKSEASSRKKKKKRLQDNLKATGTNADTITFIASL